MCLMEANKFKIARVMDTLSYIEISMIMYTLGRKGHITSDLIFQTISLLKLSIAISFLSVLLV